MAILIIGKTGFIGSNYYKYSNIKEKKFFTSSRNKKYYYLNLIRFDKKKLHNYITKKKIDKVVILSSISKPEECIRNKRKSHALNVKGTKNLINILIKQKIYFIFFSTEYIFNGKNGYYTEKSKAIPCLYYGKQKLLIENYIKLKLDKNFAIFRLSKTYGFKKNDGTLFTNILKLQKKRIILNVADDQYFAPVFIKDVIRIIDYFLVKKISGTYNISGDYNSSRFQLVKKFLNFLTKKHQNEISIKKNKLDNFTFKEKYPKNTILINNKIKKITGIKFTSITNSFKVIINEQKKS